MSKISKIADLCYLVFSTYKTSSHKISKNIAYIRYIYNSGYIYQFQVNQKNSIFKISDIARKNR